MTTFLASKINKIFNQLYNHVLNSWSQEPVFRSLWEKQPFENEEEVWEWFKILNTKRM